MSRSSEAVAAAVIVDGGRVLLARRRVPETALTWHLPGGKVERGETAEQAAMCGPYEPAPRPPTRRAGRVRWHRRQMGQACRVDEAVPRRRDGQRFTDRSRGLHAGNGTAPTCINK